MIRRVIEWRRSKTGRALLPVKRAMLGEQIMIGVDVGSAGGMQPHWRAFGGLVDFYCFEPHEESFRKLAESFAASAESRKFHVLPIGLSGSGGKRTLYMLNSPTGSSLLPVDKASEFVSANDPYIYPLRETAIDTRRLDDVLNGEGVGDVDIIKLDVQGAELEILKGLGDARIDHLLLAEVEVNICGGIGRNFGTYQGAPTWTQIDQMFTSHGMRLLDISVARAYRARNGDSGWYQREVFDVYGNSPSLSAHVWEADVVYVRDWHALIEAGDAAGLRKLTIALCGYRFFSEAYFIIEKSAEAGVLDDESAAEIKRGIVRWHHAGRNFWQGRGRPWTLLRKVMRTTGMSQLLRWKQYMWFDYPNG